MTQQDEELEKILQKEYPLDKAFLERTERQNNPELTGCLKGAMRLAKYGVKSTIRRRELYASFKPQ